MKRAEKHLDMVGGQLIPSLLSFSLPLMATSVLQQLYSAADVIVVGRYAGSQAMAAVGATEALINMLLSVFISLGAGASVMIARHLGAGDQQRIQKTVHTAVAISLISSALLAVVGIAGSQLFLTWMDTPEDILEMAALYVRIYFCGIPGNLLYNFCAGILRAKGDTRRPMVILMCTGFLNVLLNLLFVVAFRMSVDGVALATIISQYLSAIAVVFCLTNERDATRLEVKKIRVDWEEFKGILCFALPSSMGSVLARMSNVFTQSALNSFGSVAVAGVSAGSSIESFALLAINALCSAAMTFSSQNLGAKNYCRIPKILSSCVLLVSIASLLSTAVVLLFNRPLLSIYNSDPAVLDYGVRRQLIVMGPYIIMGICDLFTSQLSGMGHVTASTVMSVIGMCAFRVLWIHTVFAWYPTFEMLMLLYPASWLLTALMKMVYYFTVCKRKLVYLEEAQA